MDALKIVEAEFVEAPQVAASPETSTKPAFNQRPEVRVDIDSAKAILEAAQAAAGWPKIDEEQKLKQLPDFPLDAMPGILKPMTVEIAESVQIAPEVAALTLLTVTGAAAGRENFCSIKSGLGTRPNIFGLIFVERAGRKSSSYTPAFQPVYQWINARFIDYKRELNRYCLKLKERESCENKMAKFDIISKDKDAAKAAYESLQIEIEELKRNLRDPAFIADDTTPEGLFDLFERCHGQGAICSDDGRAFGKILKGLYNDGESREEFHLRGFDCKNPMIKHRANNRTAIIEKPFESALIMLQVDFLEKLAESEDLFQSGFMSRCFFCYPDSLAGTRFYSEREISKSVYAQYEDFISDLLDENYSRHIGDDVIYKIDQAAKDAWISFSNQIERGIGNDGKFNDLADIAIRFPEFARKLALIMAIAEKSNTITLEDMNRAISLTEYYSIHAERAFAIMKNICLPSEARSVLRTIKRKQCKEFSVRDIERATHMTAAETESGISVLAARNYVRAKSRAEEDHKTGRLPSPIYETNPAVLNK